MQTASPRHALFALTEHAIYTSTDQGERWERVSELDGVRIIDLATRGGQLIACGDGVHALDGSGLVQLSDLSCNTVVASDEVVIAAAAAQRPDEIRVWRATDDSGAWEELSPTGEIDDLVLPPDGLQFSVQIGALAAVDDTVLAGFTVLVEGSGEHTNGSLYRRSEGRWMRLDLPTPSDAVVARLVVDPDDSSRVIVLFQRSTATEQRSPLSELAFESVDGGATWASLTDSSLESLGPSDVVRSGPVTYVLNPGDGYVLRIEDGRWESIPMPVLAEFPQFDYRLQRLLFDPVDPDIAYGSTHLAWELGLVRSTDGMQTWHKMDTTIVGTSPTIVIGHPNDPSIVFTSGNVIQESFATTDGGATWQPLSPTNRDDELRIDPHDPNHIVIVDESSGLFESLDGGATFTPLGGNFTAATLLDVEIAPDELGTVYVSNLGIGISWLGPDGPVHMSNSPDYAYDIEIDPDDPTIVYATNSPKKFETHASVWRYDPAQAEAFGWSEILRVDGAAGITSLAFDASDTETIYAGVTGDDGTVWVSRDRGDSWAVLNTDLTFTTVQGQSQLLVDPDDADKLLVGTWGAGSFRTTDGGTTWSELDSAHTFSPTCLVAAPSDPDTVYACDRTAPKIHRSTDGGATWSEYFDFGPDHLTTTAIAVDPTDPDLIYAAAFRPPAAMLGSLYRIRGGELVDDIGGQLPRAVIELEIDEHDPSTLFAATHLHGLFRSDDAGANWQRLDDRDTGLPRTGYLDIAVDPVDPQALYATSLCGELPAYVTDPVEDLLATTEPFRNIDPDAPCGLYRSGDRGETWGFVLETIGEAKAIAISRSNPDRLFVADSAGGVWFSPDQGATWRQENGGLATPSVSGVAVADDRVYATTHGSGVFVGSLDDSGAITWRGGDSPRAYVHRLQVEVDPTDSQRLYASAYPGGVLRSDDGGLTWSAKNFLTPSIRVTDPVLQGYYALAIDPSDPETVWLGVYGKGLIVSHDGRDFATAANGTDPVLRGKHITSVAIDPQDSSRILVGAEEGLYLSTDAGRTWQQQDGLDTTDIRTVQFAAATSLSPFEADFEDGPGDFALEPGWGVVDGALVGEGHAWARAGSESWGDYSFESELRLSAGMVHVNARTSPEGRYFVALAEGSLHLVKQFNEWEEFADLAAAPADVMPGRRHLLRIELEGGRIRVYLDGRLHLDHTDPDPLPGGAIAFESLDDSVVAIDSLRVEHAAGSERMFAGTGGYGLYESDPATSSWASAGPTFGVAWWAPWERRMYQFSSIVFDREVEGRLYLGHFPSGFFVSDDGGSSWRGSSVGLGNDGMFSVTQHPSDPNVLLAGTYNGIVTSTDGGATWADTSAGMPPEQWPYIVAIDDENPDVMYTATKNGENKGFCHRNEVCGVVMKSVDGGRSWQRIMDGLPDKSEFYVVLIHPQDHDILFLSSSNGVFVSLDAGESWWPMDNGLADHQERGARQRGGQPDAQRRPPHTAARSGGPRGLADRRRFARRVSWQTGQSGRTVAQPRGRSRSGWTAVIGSSLSRQ